MDQLAATSQSSINPTLLTASAARSKTAQTAQTAEPQPQSLFAQHLLAAQDKPQEVSGTEKETEGEEAADNAPKIARSWRMAGAEEATRVQEDTDISWDDVVDFINPLQHIPVIGSIYRELTGDEIKPEIQIAGSVLLGALTGSLAVSAAAGIASAAYTEASGEEPSVQLAQALFSDDVIGEPSPAAGNVQLVAAEATTAEVPSSVSVAAATPPAISAPDSRAPEQSQVAQTSAIASAAKASVASASNNPSGIRVGNVLHSSPVTQKAARVGAATQKVANLSATKEKETATVQPTNENLGALLQEQAQVKESGNTLPPDLVRDMMVMALDKYKTAQAMGTQQTTGTP